MKNVSVTSFWEHLSLISSKVRLTKYVLILHHIQIADPAPKLDGIGVLTDFYDIIEVAKYMCPT